MKNLLHNRSLPVLNVSKFSTFLTTSGKNTVITQQKIAITNDTNYMRASVSYYLR